MSDPKNIPLSEARPGDMVFLKPLTLSNARTGLGLYICVGPYDLPTAWIDHIERAPRVLKVGAPVKNIGTDTLYGTVIGLRGKWAWVLPEREGAPPDTVNTLYLEPVDD